MNLEERVVLLAQAIGTDVKELYNRSEVVLMETVEVNLSNVPRLSGSFKITGLAGLTPGKAVLIMQAPGPYTGKGTLADESSDMVIANAYVLDATTIQAYWQSVRSPIRGNIKFNYKILA